MDLFIWAHGPHTMAIAAQFDSAYALFFIVCSHGCTRSSSGCPNGGFPRHEKPVTHIRFNIFCALQFLSRDGLTVL